MADHDILFIGFDADVSNGCLLCFSLVTVIDNFQSLETIIKTASGQQKQRILVGLATQTHYPLVLWIMG